MRTALKGPRSPGRDSRPHVADLLARLEGVEPPARGFEGRSAEDTAASAASQSVTLRGVSGSPVSPNVSTLPANHGEFAALVLHELLSPKQAAERLGVHRETVYRLCARGELPHVRLGSVLRVDLAAYLARRQRS